MSDNRRQYHNVRNALKTCYPFEPKCIEGGFDKKGVGARVILLRVIDQSGVI